LLEPCQKRWVLIDTLPVRHNLRELGEEPLLLRLPLPLLNTYQALFQPSILVPELLDDLAQLGLALQHRIVRDAPDEVDHVVPEILGVFGPHEWFGWRRVRFRLLGLQKLPYLGGKLLNLSLELPVLLRYAPHLGVVLALEGVVALLPQRCLVLVPCRRC